MHGWASALRSCGHAPHWPLHPCPHLTLHALPCGPSPEYWGLEGYRCDNWPSLTRSGLCYRPPPLGLPPTLAGLFWMRSSNATADAGPPAAADGVAARPPAAAGDAGGPWEVTATAGEAPFPDPS